MAWQVPTARHFGIGGDRLARQRVTVAGDDVGREAGAMLDLSKLDLEEIATALADQSDYERR